MQALRLMTEAGHAVESIIHVGANNGQERLHYAEIGACPCIHVEPIDEVYEVLRENIKDLPGQIAVKAVCAEEEGLTVNFNIASNNGESSSFLDLGAHAGLFPSISYIESRSMITTTVDRVLDSLGLAAPPNLLVIDTQGTEMNVLRGARRTLSSVEGLYVEVSEEPLYAGGCTFWEIATFVKQFGLNLRWTSLNRHGFGDAFFSRAKSQAPLPSYSGNYALGCIASQSSTSKWSKPNDANGALTGVRTGSYGFHTEREVNPWWAVDLGALKGLHEIRIYNRADAGRERSRTLQVLISTGQNDWVLVHDQRGRTFSGIDGQPLRVMVEGKIARHVRLQLNDENYLHLDQVEVY